MLAARPLRAVCLPCQLHLLALFENSSRPCPRASILSRSRSGIYRAREVPSQPFSTSHARSKPNEIQGHVRDSASPESPTTPEDIVRHTRLTFGESLPQNYLTREEYVIYERLYGPPLRTTTTAELEAVFGEEETRLRDTLVSRNTDKGLEEVYHSDAANSAGPRTSTYLRNFASADAIDVVGKNPQEIETLIRLQQDMVYSMAASPEEEEDPEYEPNEEPEDEEDEDGGYDDVDEPDVYTRGDFVRTHPLTLAGRSGTEPSTITLPETGFTAPVAALLADSSNKHLQDVAQRVFGGPGLPYSTATPTSKRHLPQKTIGLDASQSRMGEMEGNVYLAAVMPGAYAAVMSTLVEVRKRLNRDWLSDLLKREGGPRVLDAGAGGAGIIAWREVLKAEWESMQDERKASGLKTFTEEPPWGKATVVTGSDALRHRVSRFLDDTTFLPRLPDFVHPSETKQQNETSTQKRKLYDVIIAPHTLWPLREDYQRKLHVQNLWSLLNPNGGVLILIEKGVPRGFEAIAGARDMLLTNHIAFASSLEFATELQSPSDDPFTPKETGMIIAPCTNHTKCPMYLTPGLNHGRKDFCHFKQRYIRPSYLQTLIGAHDRNHEDVQFSYVAVRRGRDDRANGLVQGEAAAEAAFTGHSHESSLETLSPADVHPLSLPRAILPPLKRRNHVILDLCTPAGRIERWTVPRSFGRQAYRDARKSTWGDLWALGAKTRVQRTIRLGKGEQQKDGKKNKNIYEVGLGEEGMEDIVQKTDRIARREKRDQKGRKAKATKKITENSF